MGEHVSDQVSESTVSVGTEGDVVVVRLDDGKANALSHEIIDAPVSYTHLTLPTSDLV